MMSKSQRFLAFILPVSFVVALLLYPINASAQVPWPSQMMDDNRDIGPPADFNPVPKAPGHYTTADWAAIIDATWGPGLPTSTKLAIFDEAWNIFNAKYAAFQNLGVDWDSLRSIYRPIVADTANPISRGRFAAIMNHLGLALQSIHTFIDNIPVNRNTPLGPGVPLFVIGTWTSNSHFGASLTPLPDSSLLVFKALPDHTLGLITGDIVLGYDGIPWKVLYKDLLAAQLPIFRTYGAEGSTESSLTHNLLMSAGMNWHLFDTLDVVKFASGDTLHLSTAPLAGQTGFIWGNEQLRVPDVPWPEISEEDVFLYGIMGLGDYVSWGIVEGTQIGYIYVIAWFNELQSPGSSIVTEFYNAVDSLMNVHETAGLILDFRLNYGGIPPVSHPGFSLLFNSTVETTAFDQRCGDPSNHFQMCPHPLYTRTWMTIPGNPATFYDRPIAVLTGPGAMSAGDFNALNMKFHPMARLFGKPTSGGFSAVDAFDGSLGSNNDWVYMLTTSNACLVSDPGSYLAHTELEIDEEVWLTQEDVAKGEDTVVKRAMEWIQNLVHAHDAAVDRVYATPGVDTLSITVQVENPNNHNVSAQARLVSMDSTVVDSTSLYDDGNHNDSAAGDGIWGCEWPVPLEEKVFLVGVKTIDSTDGTTHLLPNATFFTTIGPMVLDSLVVTGPADGRLIPGDRVELDLFLRNNGKTATVPDIWAKISTSDTCARITSSIRTFGDIAPGETTTHTGYYLLYINADCSGNVDIPITLSITSDGYVFWSDSFSIHVFEDTTTGIADEGVLPTEFALHQNYPNPFNPVSTIRYELPQAAKVALMVYDILGREVARLVDSHMEPGYQQVQWDGCDASGKQVSSGIYIAQLVTPGYSKSIKMVLLK
jgi:hypothetical protein